jgi:hypothetical protein
MRTVLVVLAALAAASCASAPPAADHSAHFEKLKSLAGTWEQSGQTDAPPGTKVVYRVTSGGSAVQSVEFGGTPHEMVTLYTLDRGRLVLTHYCALGNQPRMELTAAEANGPLVFDCVSLGNGDLAKDMHMHHAEITFVDANHVNSAWTLWKDGKATDTHGFTLVRVAD